MKKNLNNTVEALNFSAKVREPIETVRMRSAWDRGVQAYALELLDNSTSMYGMPLMTAKRFPNFPKPRY